MRRLTPQNVFLVAKREYLETVRTKAFMIMTILAPVFMFGVSVMPTLLISNVKAEKAKIMIVASQAEYGQAVKDRLENPPEPKKPNDIDKLKKNNEESDKRQTFDVQLSSDLSETAKNNLLAKLDSKELDGILWLDDNAISEHKAQYFAREANNFNLLGTLQNRVRDAVIHKSLTVKGMNEDDISKTLQPFDLETVKWEKGKAKKANELAQFLAAIFMTIAIYITVLMYGLGVMRSVLEEKKSRIMEVLMSTLTADDLLAGKIVGVAFVGITQIAIWTLGGAILASAGIVTTAAAAMRDSNLNLTTAFYFLLFFLLGYLLYSSMCAALGAMCNSEQEAGQLQTFVMLPMIISITMMVLVITQPDNKIVVIMSMFPFCTPVLMYTRIVVGHPPPWQIWTSVGLMILTIFITLSIASRIYRVGVLMYGKRPTLPELMKWIRYS
jgi:ABC-2 type transport system permease protein